RPCKGIRRGDSWRNSLRGGNSDSWSELLKREVQSLEPRVEGLATDAEDPREAALVTARLLERRENPAALVEAGIGDRAERRGSPAEERKQRCRIHEGGFGVKRRHPSHDVFQLADVAGPRVRPEHGFGVSRQLRPLEPGVEAEEVARQRKDVLLAIP